VKAHGAETSSNRIDTGRRGRRRPDFQASQPFETGKKKQKSKEFVTHRLSVLDSSGLIEGFGRK
jgi:hypothetical protein